MPRPILGEAHAHPAIRSQVANHEQAIVQELMALRRVTMSLSAQCTPTLQRLTELFDDFYPGCAAGGATDLVALIDKGELKSLVKSLVKLSL